MEKVTPKAMNIIMAALYMDVCSGMRHFDDKVVKLREILDLDTSTEFIRQAEEILYILRIEAFDKQRGTGLKNVLTGENKPNRYFLGLINRVDLYPSIDEVGELYFERLTEDKYEKLKSKLNYFNPNPLYEELQATDQTSTSFSKRMMSAN